MQMFDLSGQIAVVTGGSRGIGFGIAEGYARAGASVIIANRRPEMGQRAIEQLRQEGLTATSIPVDVRSVSSTAELASRVIRDFGRIDVLVNDAGITLRRPAEEVTEEDWDDVVDTNLKGCFFCCQAIAKEMIRRKKGKIMPPPRPVFLISPVPSPWNGENTTSE